MADLRAITLAPAGASWQGAQDGLMMVLEQAENGFTVDNTYEVLSLVVDCDATLPNPKPFAVCFNDAGHLKLVDLAKLKRA